MNYTEKMDMMKERIQVPKFESFPDIELYMDQVLDFLSRSEISFRGDDKLTSAMVNNYIKADILPRAKGKKYTKEHMAYLSVIMRLKRVLSVKDTGELIKANVEDKSAEEFYGDFSALVDKSATELRERFGDFNADLREIAMKLAIESYLCIVASELIIDKLNQGDSFKSPLDEEN